MRAKLAPAAASRAKAAKPADWMRRWARRICVEQGGWWKQAFACGDPCKHIVLGRGGDLRSHVLGGAAGGLGDGLHHLVLAEPEVAQLQHRARPRPVQQHVVELRPQGGAPRERRGRGRATQRPRGTTNVAAAAFHRSTAPATARLQSCRDAGVRCVVHLHTESQRRTQPDQQETPGVCISSNPKEN